MKQMIYNAMKIAVAVVLAIFVANMIGLQFQTTAGVIAMLGILDNRKQTYIVGLKRIVTSLVAIFLASILFELGGHSLPMLGLFMLTFIPVVTTLKSSEGLSISTVLITHIYTINDISIDVVINELALLLVGIGVAFIMNVHMPNIEQDIRKLQENVERNMKDILRKMSFQLLNQCTMEEQLGNLKELDNLIDEGTNQAIRYNNNYILKDYGYYIRYFQMRREQYHILVHMENHFKTIFTTADQAEKLATFTRLVINAFNECNTGEKQLEEANRLMDIYRRSELPKTREEFEHRAVLFQYFSDLIYFIEIKSDFMRRYGAIKYCE